MYIEQLLYHAKKFQDMFCNSHIGGSLGLYLHGIDLKRDITKSDIDMTCKSKLPEPLDAEQFEESSSPTDFDYSLRLHDKQSNIYAKIEVRVSPEPSFVVINHNGIDYNVSLLENILFWKQKYADKGVQKHIDDMIVINGGERPPIPEVTYAYANDDDLPF